MSISIKEAKEKINTILNDVVCSEDEYKQVILPMEDTLANYDINEFKKKFVVGDCIIPKNIDSIPKLTLPNHKFIAPRTVDLRDYCTPTQNQGSRPTCAAQSAASFAENILWRKNDFYEDIDPEMIYSEAKKIDGDPNGGGTTLTAVLQVLLNKGYFDKNKCSIKVIWNSGDFINQLKYCIHKYGCCLLACNATEEWVLCNRNKTSITGHSHNTPLGGHATLACYYDHNGIGILNSWSESFGSFGFALITWEALKKQFLYAAVLDNCLYDMHMN